MLADLFLLSVSGEFTAFLISRILATLFSDVPVSIQRLG